MRDHGEARPLPRAGLVCFWSKGSKPDAVRGAFLVKSCEMLEGPRKSISQTEKAVSAGFYCTCGLLINEGDGTRTRNHRIDSPPISRSNSNPHKEIATPAVAGRSAGRSDEQGEGGVADADLAALVAAWPTLPAPIKAAIRALVGSAAG